MSKLSIPIGVSETGLKEVLTYWFRAKAYVTPLSLDEVAKKTSSRKQTIQRQLAFLLQIGILEKVDDRYKLTDDGRFVAQYQEYSQYDDFQAKMKILVSKWSEIQPILDYIEDTRSVHYSTLTNRIMMYSERAPSDKNVLMGAQALADLLISAGILSHTDYKIKILDRMKPGTETPIITSSDKGNELWIKTIRIRNVKSILDTQFNTSKMNIFIGANAAGKSSILHALLSLRNLKWQRNFGATAYDNLSSLMRKGADESIFVEFEGFVLDDDSEIPFDLRITFSQSMSFCWQLCVKKESFRLCDTSITSKANDLKVPLSLYKGLDKLKEFSEKISEGISAINELFKDAIDYHKSEQTSESLQSVVSYFEDNQGNIDYSYQERGLLASWPKFLPEYLQDDAYKSIRTNYLRIRPAVSSYIDSIEFVPVLRGFLRKEYEQRKNPPERIPEDIEYVLYIINKMVYKDFVDTTKVERMREWAEKFGIRDFETVITPGPKIEPRGKRLEKDEVFPISLHGFGLNQILALIGKCIFAENNAPILIEEPEIHLHPAYQAQSADFLIETMKEGHQLFIATHSEHLIGRIQRRIAEGILKPQDVRILWVTFDSEKGTKVEEVKIDKSGILHDGLQTYLRFLEEEMRSTERARRERKG